MLIGVLTVLAPILAMTTATAQTSMHQSEDPVIVKALREDAAKQGKQGESQLTCRC